MYLTSNISLKSKTSMYFALKIYTIVLIDKSCYHSVINKMSVFLSSNSCAAVDPPPPLDEAIFIKSCNTLFLTTISCVTQY